jgi:hypothetical protein
LQSLTGFIFFLTLPGGERRGSDKEEDRHGMCGPTRGSRKRDESMKQKTDLGLFKIRGIIIPSSWNEEGHALSVAVSTFDEEEYFVEKDPKGDQLLEQLREKVEVSGVVRVDEGTKTIKVKDYVLIEK